MPCEENSHNFAPTPNGTHLFCSKCGHNVPLTVVPTPQPVPRRQKLCQDCKKVFTPGEYSGGCLHSWKKYKNKCEYCYLWIDQVANQPGGDICLKNDHFGGLD